MASALRLNKSARNLLEVKQNAGRFFFRTTFIQIMQNYANMQKGKQKRLWEDKSLPFYET